MDGLTVKGGRLINNRPDGISGIQEACMLKKSMKRANKIEMMAEAIELGEMRADYFRG